MWRGTSDWIARRNDRGQVPRHSGDASTGRLLILYSVCGLRDVFHHPQTKRDRDAALRPGRSMSASSLIGRLGQALSGYPPTPVSMSLTGSRFSSDSAPRALPSWDSKTRWNYLSGDLAVNMTAGSSGHTNSPHPSSREGHHSTVGWSSISSYCIGSCTDLKLLRLPWSTEIRCRQPTRGA